MKMIWTLHACAWAMVAASAMSACTFAPHHTNKTYEDRTPPSAMTGQGAVMTPGQPVTVVAPATVVAPN